MFCAKCGLKILANQQFCPNCGAKNENYSGEKKRRIIPLSAAIVVVLGIAGSIFLLRKNSSSLSIHNEYVKRGAVGYVSAEGNASFLIDGDRVKFSGGIVTARTSPDYSKYIILNDSGELLLYINPEGASQKIAENVYEISEVNNQGVFIKEKSAERLKFYYFDGKKEFDTGFDGDYTIQYSANGMSVAGLDAEGELYIYTVGNDSVNNLGKAGEEIELCAVADSGENVIWSDEKDQNICVYMMQNGAQERIGKLGKPEQYHSVYAYFFDDGKSFIVYSAKAGKMLLSIDCEYPREINIAGVKGYGGIMDQDGRPIYSQRRGGVEVFIVDAPAFQRGIQGRAEAEQGGSAQKLLGRAAALFGRHSGVVDDDIAQRGAAGMDGMEIAAALIGNGKLHVSLLKVMGKCFSRAAQAGGLARPDAVQAFGRGTVMPRAKNGARRNQAQSCFSQGLRLPRSRASIMEALVSKSLRTSRILKLSPLITL